MKTKTKSNRQLVSACKSALFWLDGQEELYGLTASGVRKYKAMVSRLKTAIRNAQ